MCLEEGESLRNKRNKKNISQAWMMMKGKHPLSTECVGFLYKIYFIHMAGGKWLEIKTGKSFFCIKICEEQTDENWGSEELNSLSASRIYKSDSILAYLYRNSIAGHSHEYQRFSILGQKSPHLLSWGWQKRSPHSHP